MKRKFLFLYWSLSRKTSDWVAGGGLAARGSPIPADRDEAIRQANQDAVTAAAKAQLFKVDLNWAAFRDDNTLPRPKRHRWSSR